MRPRALPSRDGAGITGGPLLIFVLFWTACGLPLGIALAALLWSLWPCGC